MERFVVSTGRCGSTLLDKMMNHHPDLLMISECMGAPDRANAFNAGIITKDQLKNLLLSSIPIVDLAVRRGNITKEQQYEVKDHVNFSIPAYLYICFPTLTDKPDELFAELMELIDTFPDQTMTEHYLQIFNWLTRKFDRKIWCERTGGSIEFMPGLYKLFPNAKYLHIHRNGPDAVLSMKNHAYFQMLVSLFTRPVTREELEQTELAGKPISMDDPISQRLFARQPSYTDFAAYWNYQLAVGYSVFAKMDPTQYMDIRYEDMIAEPHRIMNQIADFFELPNNSDWVDKAAEIIDTNEVSSSIANLSEDEQETLINACMPGQILLNRIEPPWIHSSMNLIREMSNSSN